MCFCEYEKKILYPEHITENRAGNLVQECYPFLNIQERAMNYLRDTRPLPTSRLNVLNSPRPEYPFYGC